MAKIWTLISFLHIPILTLCSPYGLLVTKGSVPFVLPDSCVPEGYVT
jgi:hypothetical protein